ncbi:unnamed protein product [Orchesella dallaii]|uniref:Odorant receptor n=1 Tax=Orchesella dallaii TaxID=48710 RepID=A0ABP1RMJ7_9HEXA
MLTKNMKNLIKFRLGVIKYAVSSVFYWEHKIDKCVCSSPYIFYIWCTSYYSCVAGLPLLCAVVYLHIMEKMDDTVDEGSDEDDLSSLYKEIGTIFTILIGFLMLFCALLVSILKQYKYDFRDFYNGCFQMDLNLKDGFINEDENRKQLLEAAMDTKDCKLVELTLAIATFSTLCPPIMMFVFMFHPCDPMHRILVDLMEIEVAFSSPRAIILAAFYGWSVFALCCTFKPGNIQYCRQITNKLMKNLIKFRLGVIKYAVCSVFYWEYKIDKCVCSSPYIYYIWCTSYYSGVVCLPLLCAVVYFHMMEKMDDTVDEGSDEDDLSSLYKEIGTIFTILIGFILLFCVLLVSILKQYKYDFRDFYNGCFQMDLDLKDGFINENENRKQLLEAAMDAKVCKLVELTLSIATFGTLCPPIMMFFFMFHPFTHVIQCIEFWLI